MSQTPSQTFQKEQSSRPQQLQTLKTMQLKSLKSMIDGPPQDDDSMVDLQYEKELTNIDYEKMKTSIKKNHVIKDNNEFYTFKEACWDFNSGNHYVIKSSEKSDLNKFGVGIMLYFKFVKRLAVFFFLFTLLSIPAFVFYISAYSAYSETTGDSVSYLDALTATTVGAVGLDSSSCAVRKFPNYASQDSEKTLYFKCYKGTISTADTIIYGLAQLGTTCTLIDETDLTTSCNTYDATALSTIATACVGQTSCEIEVPLALFDTTDSTCGSLYPFKNVYMQVGCDADTVEVAGNDVSKLSIAYVVAAFDAAIIIIFILMIYTLKYAQKNATKNVQNKVYSASSYTVEFRNLPQDMAAEQLSAKLWAFIEEKLGEKAVQAGHRVIDVQVVLPNKLIEYSKAVGTIIHTKNTLIREFIQTYCSSYTKPEIDFNGLQQIMKKMVDENDPQLKGAEKMFRRIKELSTKKLKLLSQIQKLKTSNNVRIVCAFVTFSSIPARNKILDMFISSPIERLARAFCSRLYEKDTKFCGKTLRVGPSADPGSILWENLGEPGKKIFLRRAFSWILTILLWIVTAAILIVSTYYKNVFKESFPTVDCNGRAPTDIQAATDYLLGEYQVGLLECFCSDDLVGRLNYVFTTASDQTLCLTWFTNKVIETSITFAIVFVVLIINYVVQFVFQGLSQFEKHSTLNKQLATRVVKTFAAQFLNTGLILLLVNAKLDDISFWQGKFRDLTPIWYTNVGSTLLSTMLINVVTVPTVKVAALLLNRIARCLDRNCKSDARITKKKSQKSYEELYSGPEFIIDFRYSQILTLIFVCFLYSAGMPFLYVTSFLQLTITYFFDKVFLLKASKLPKNYDEKLEAVVRPILYVILIAHLIFAIFMFGSSTIFNQGSSALTSLTTSTNMKAVLSQKTENVVRQFFRRTVMDFNIVLLVVLIILVALFLVKGIILGFLRSTVFAIFTKDGEKTQKKGAKITPDEQANHTFLSVLKADHIASLIRLTKVTLKTTENKQLSSLLQAKLALLKQEYQIKQQSGGEAVDFLGFYTYDVRLQSTYAAQFAINEMLDDENLD